MKTKQQNNVTTTKALPASLEVMQSQKLDFTRFYIVCKTINREYQKTASNTSFNC